LEKSTPVGVEAAGRSAQGFEGDGGWSPGKRRASVLASTSGGKRGRYVGKEKDRMEKGNVETSKLASTFRRRLRGKGNRPGTSGKGKTS